MSEIEFLAKNTKKTRKELGETQPAFALHCGLSEDVISQIELGHTDPKLSTVRRIAAYTGKTVSELLTGETDAK